MKSKSLTAEKTLAKVPKKERMRIIEKIDALESGPQAPWKYKFSINRSVALFTS